MQYAVKLDGFNRDEWPAAINWHVEQMTKLEQAIKTPLQQAAQSLKLKDKG